MSSISHMILEVGYDGKTPAPSHLSTAIATRNPPWSRDEFVLALDLYFRHPPSQISQSHPEVIALSEALNSLPFHSDRPDEERFRDPNGVDAMITKSRLLSFWGHGREQAVYQLSGAFETSCARPC